MVHQATPFGKASAGNLLFKDTLTRDNSKQVVPQKECRCLRKGCDNRFLPKTANQKYCQQPACRSELVRWANLKRQRKRRLDPSIQAREAEAQKQRRQRNKTEDNVNLVAPSFGHSDCLPEECQASEVPGALSRCDCIPKDFCDRPGCYEPKAVSHGNTSKYCGQACRNAVHRARERIRRYRTARYQWPMLTGNSSGSAPKHVSLPPFPRSNLHDSKTSSRTRSRAPPA